MSKNKMRHVSPLAGGDLAPLGRGDDRPGLPQHLVPTPPLRPDILLAPVRTRIFIEHTLTH